MHAIGFNPIPDEYAAAVGSGSARTDRRAQLFTLARTVNGFMPDDEGEALYLAALRAGASADRATLVEIGGWCGKSTTYIEIGRAHV